MKRILFALLASGCLLVHGCQSAHVGGAPQAVGIPLEGCQGMLDRMDRAVVDGATTDTSVFRITGYPFLRSNRFLADLAQRPTDAPATRRWLEGMHRLDLAAREKEILNLDDARIRQFADPSRRDVDRQALIREVCACTRRLFAAQADTAGLAAAVRKALEVPEEYRTWRRVLGIYPLAALPVTYVSAAVFDKFRDWHRMPPEKLPGAGRPVVYSPAAPGDEDRIDPEHLFQQTPRDTLGLPLLAPQDEHRLVTALAPVVVQDTAAAYDRIGAIRWQDGTPAVTPEVPVAYYYLSHGRFDDRPILQVNYVFWYSHRAGANSPWIERGQLDGLTVRISLDPSGRPAMLDIMNNCGCYHFFVPDHARIRRIKRPLMGLDPLVPAWLPQTFPEQRLQLMVTSGWHQVLRISAANAAPPAVSYALRPYEELEMLPDESGKRRSIFNQDGIAHGTARIEQAIFFSMGVPAVGSMRQRSHHAIQLVGRAHFDDPLLFDTTFDYR